MRPVFADTCYWIALANPDDQLHAAALRTVRSMDPFRTITTDEVLSEFLTFFSRSGPAMRECAVRIVRSLLSAADVEVVSQSRDSFSAGLLLYESRQDKGYSLTDCSSMAMMRARAIQEVLTSDRHFLQEGFRPLLTPARPATE
jgi:uncharacterized protein